MPVRKIVSALLLAPVGYFVVFVLFAIPMVVLGGNVGSQYGKFIDQFAKATGVMGSWLFLSMFITMAGILISLVMKKSTNPQPWQWKVAVAGLTVMALLTFLVMVSVWLGERGRVYATPLPWGTLFYGILGATVVAGAGVIASFLTRAKRIHPQP